MADLVTWKNSKERKPLIVNGARQVGKTWLVEEFARRHFDDLAHIVLLDNDEMQRAFEKSLYPDRLFTLIGAATGTNPDNGDTLVFLDEIQECPRAITSLKLFRERMPHIPVISAGSLPRRCTEQEEKGAGSTCIVARRQGELLGFASDDVLRVHDCNGQRVARRYHRARRRGADGIVNVVLIPS